MTGDIISRSDDDRVQRAEPTISNARPDDDIGDEGPTRIDVINNCANDNVFCGCFVNLRRIAADGDPTSGYRLACHGHNRTIAKRARLQRQWIEEGAHLLR